jgi:hypothetical protein
MFFFRCKLVNKMLFRFLNKFFGFVMFTTGTYMVTGKCSLALVVCGLSCCPASASPIGCAAKIRFQANIRFEANMRI